MSEAREPPRYGLHAALFALTFASMMYVGRDAAEGAGTFDGWKFALPLLSILLVHELGHWVAGRLRDVDVSLPYFIPLPIGLFGTLGAVITMRSTPKSRNSLFDVGASGPIAGLCIAVPVLFLGLRWSHVEPIPPHGLDEGQSLLYLAMKRAVLGPIPAGHDVLLHPTAFAGWAGLFMTMLNLIPVGQLDGGHVAYALLGTRADRLSVTLRRVLVAVALVVGLGSVARARMSGATWSSAASAIFSGLIWIVYWILLGLLTFDWSSLDPRAEPPPSEPGIARAKRVFARLVFVFRSALFGPRAPHPPTEDATLSPGRRVVAIVTLALFFLMFTPVPMSEH